MSKEEISPFQFVAMFVWTVMATGVLALPFAIGQFVVRDGWISAILLLPAALFSSGLISLFMRTFPRMSLAEGLFFALGKFFGFLAVMWLLVALLISVSTILREVAVFVEVSTLPFTPVYVISLLATIPMAFLVYTGVESMGRYAVLLTILAVIIGSVMLGLALRNVTLSHLTPVLADGWRPVLRGAVQPWAFSIELMLGLQFISAMSTSLRSHFGKWILVIGIILSLLGVVAEVHIVALLGYQVTYSNYPILEAIRLVHFGEFLERLDPFYVMGAVSLIILKASVFFHVLLTVMRQALRLPHHRSMLWSAALLSWAGSIFLYKDSVAVQGFLGFTMFGYFAVTFWGLPLLAILVQRIRSVLS